MNHELTINMHVTMQNWFVVVLDEEGHGHGVKGGGGGGWSGGGERPST